MKPDINEFIKEATVTGKLIGETHEERWALALHLFADEPGWVREDCRAFVRALVADAIGQPPFTEETDAQLRAKSERAAVDRAGATWGARTPREG